MPKPMTPDMTDLPKHDSMAACTYDEVSQRRTRGRCQARRANPASNRRTARTLGSWELPARPPAGAPPDGKFMLPCSVVGGAVVGGVVVGGGWGERLRWCLTGNEARFFLLVGARGVRQLRGSQEHQIFLPLLTASRVSDGCTAPPSSFGPTCRPNRPGVCSFLVKDSCKETDWP